MSCGGGAAKGKQYPTWRALFDGCGSPEAAHNDALGACVGVWDCVGERVSSERGGVAKATVKILCQTREEDKRKPRCLLLLGGWVKGFSSAARNASESSPSKGVHLIHPTHPTTPRHAAPQAQSIRLPSSPDQAARPAPQRRGVDSARQAMALSNRPSSISQEARPLPHVLLLTPSPPRPHQPPPTHPPAHHHSTTARRPGAHTLPTADEEARAQQAASSPPHKPPNANIQAGGKGHKGGLCSWGPETDQPKQTFLVRATTRARNDARRGTSSREASGRGGKEEHGPAE